MKELLRKLVRYISYVGAALIILLALAVGIFRLMLPRLPEYQEEIKGWASAAIGLDVEFADMNARWRLSGPEVSFFNAELIQAATGERVLSTQEVSVGVGLLRLIADREFVVDRIFIRDTDIDVRQDVNGDWLLQGRHLRDIIGTREVSSDVGVVDIVAEDIGVSYEHPATGQIVRLAISSMTVSRDENEIGLDAQIALPQEFGSQLHVSANQLADAGDEGVWSLYVEGSGLNLAGWSRLRPVGLPEIYSGQADLSLWLDLADGAVQRATSNLVVTSLQAESSEILPPVGIEGSFEYSVELNGWLLAANQFRLTTVDGDWPQSALQARVRMADDGEMDGVRATASYLKLDDFAYFAPWLGEELRDRITAFAANGELRALRADISGLQSERPLFDVTTDIDTLGFAAIDEQPGLQGFSGRLRADRDGGRIEIESTGLTLDFGALLPEPITFDDAYGTIIWRRNDQGVIVLSDSVRIRNADLDSESNLQLSVPANGAAPVLDLESSWSIYDIGSMDRYLPPQHLKPGLYRWLSSALVSGYVTRGTTRFNGPLDAFPFDNGEGSFRVDAKLEDATLKYAATWPAANFRHLDLVIENARLYSTENSATNVGNNVEDAEIEIADLRNPVLQIDAFATGTLETIRQYAMQSPIHNVLGGQLDRVEVSGDASFDLSLTVPILDRLDFDFMTRIRSSDGSIRVAGLAAPVTELNGVVTITRSDVSSEALFGRFLGEPVDIALSRSADPNAPHSVILEANGRASIAGLANELNEAARAVGHGTADYQATVRFPNARADEPGKLQVFVQSDLQGISFDLPEPLAKSPDDALPLSTTIEFTSFDNILNSGSLAGTYNWSWRFRKENDSWDFDRGILAVGGEYPVFPDVRGLRIAGRTGTVRLTEWLDLARRGGGRGGLGERIRSIDLVVEDLHAIGQHYRDHRVQVDRSGLDWVIRISGEQAEGLISVPYDYQSGRVMTLDMDRLVLPGDDTAEEDPDGPAPDPRALPSISVVARDFALGERNLGALSVDLTHTARGLETDNLSLSAESLSIEGSAGWIIDAYEETGQRTYVEAALRSTDIEATMARLNYSPGIVGDDMEVAVDVSWAGPPRRDFMGDLNGTVTARIGAGQLEDVEPGAGRVFGLMSIVALPRRLSLDFRDVFDSGFGFDEVSGDFRIVDGDAYTCNLSMTGPAADVGIIGRAGLVTREYAQAAVVSANVGNTLPIAGFVIAGPQVAAALLIFSQVFKKPLQEVAQVSYSIEGSWDEPVIDNADAEQFARISSLAGCSDSAQ